MLFYSSSSESSLNWAMLEAYLAPLPKPARDDRSGDPFSPDYNWFKPGDEIAFVSCFSEELGAAPPVVRFATAAVADKLFISLRRSVFSLHCLSEYGNIFLILFYLNEVVVPMAAYRWCGSIGAAFLAKILKSRNSASSSAS